MQIIHWVPGIVATPTVFALPAWAPDIDAISGVVVLRMPQAIGAHVEVGDLAHTDTGVPIPVHAGCTVNAHAAHAHALNSMGLGAGIAPAIGWDNGAAPTQLEDAGAVSTHTLAGGLATGIQDFTIPAHVMGAQSNDHAAADILAAVDDHTQAEIAAVLDDHAAVDPDIGAVVATRQTARTLFLDTNTQIHDIVILAYHEVGARVAVS